MAPETLADEPRRSGTKRIYSFLSPVAKCDCGDVGLGSRVPMLGEKEEAQFWQGLATDNGGLVGGCGACRALPHDMPVQWFREQNNKVYVL